MKSKQNYGIETNKNNWNRLKDRYQQNGKQSELYRKSVKPKVDSLVVLVKQSPEKINQEEREDTN